MMRYLMLGTVVLAVLLSAVGSAVADKPAKPAAVNLVSAGPGYMTTLDGRSFTGALFLASLPTPSWASGLHLSAALFVANAPTGTGYKPYPGLSTTVSIAQSVPFVAGVAWVPSARHHMGVFASIDLTKAFGFAW